MSKNPNRADKDGMPGEGFQGYLIERSELVSAAWEYTLHITMEKVKSFLKDGRKVPEKYVELIRCTRYVMNNWGDK